MKIYNFVKDWLELNRKFSKIRTDVVIREKFIQIGGGVDIVCWLESAKIETAMRYQLTVAELEFLANSPWHQKPYKQEIYGPSSFCWDMTDVTPGDYEYVEKMTF